MDSKKAAEALALAAKKDLDEAEKVLHASEKPRRDRDAKAKAFNAAQSAVDTLKSKDEAQRRERSQAIVTPVRAGLWDQFQTERLRIDRHSSPEERNRVNGLLQACNELAYLPESGEQDIPAAVRRIVNSVPPPPWAGFSASDEKKNYQTAAVGG